MIHGNWRRATDIKDEMEKVTLADLNRVFNKYVTNITWAYQGNPKQVDAKLYTQKETPPVPRETKAF